jgi:hypothetical protein
MTISAVSIQYVEKEWLTSKIVNLVKCLGKL